MVRWRFDFFSLVNTRPIRLFSGLKMLHPRALLLSFFITNFMPFDGIKLNWSNISSTNYFCHSFDNSLARATPSLLLGLKVSVYSEHRHVFNISWWHCQTFLNSSTHFKSVRYFQMSCFAFQLPPNCGNSIISFGGPSNTLQSLLKLFSIADAFPFQFKAYLRF